MILQIIMLCPLFRKRNSFKSVYALHIHLIGYITHFTKHRYPREATSTAASQEIPLILGNHKFINFPTRFRHLSPSWAHWISSTPSHLVSARPCLVLSSHLRFGLPIGSFLQTHPHLSPPKKPVYFSPPYVLNSQPIPHLPWFSRLNNNWWGTRVLNFLVMQSYPPLSCLKSAQSFKIFRKHVKILAP